MSKRPERGSRITLLDPPDLITKKIKRAKQTLDEPDWQSRRKTDNLIGLYAILSGKGREAAAKVCRHGLGQVQAAPR